MMITRTLFLLLLLPTLALAQHRGNFADANVVSQKAMGNARANVTQGMGYQYVPQSLATNPVLTLDLKALHNLEADSYTAVFSIIQIGETAASTTAAMEERVNAVRSKLRAKGVLDDDIATDIIAFKPVYEIHVENKIFSKKYTEVPAGFKLQQNLMIRFDDTSVFDAVMRATSESEIYDIVKVDYYVEDIDKYYQVLQEKLLDLVQKKRDFYAALGLNLADYKLQIADKNYYHVPRNFYKSYQMSQSVSMDVLKKQRNLTTATRPVTYYYDPIPYDNYDVVMNPSILEPVIQIGYDLQLQFIPKPEKPAPMPEQPDPKYYVISPSGPLDIKQLPKT